MKNTADDIYRLDLQKPSIPLACPRCGKSYIVIQWLPGGQWGIAHRCSDNFKPIEVRFNSRSEAVIAWNHFAKGEPYDGQDADPAAPGTGESEPPRKRGRPRKQSG